MKKFIAAFLMMAVMAIMMPIAASAQTYYYKQRVYRNGSYHLVRVYKKPSFYRRHRNAMNIAMGTGAGALIGGIAGGRKGALIGTAVGAGGSSLYTYKIRPKKRRYYRVRNY